MTTLEQVEHLLPRLNPSEMLLLLRRLADELARDEAGIEADPRVCGGEARVKGTRLPAWVLIQAARLGQTDADILRAYPTLTAEGLAHARAYALTHPERITHDIDANEAA